MKCAHYATQEYPGIPNRRLVSATFAPQRRCSPQRLCAAPYRDSSNLCVENGFDNELAVSWTTESDSRCLTKSPLGEGCAVAQNFNSEYTGEVCLTLSVLPWHSMVAAPCQELLSFIGFGASSMPPLQRICPCLPKTWAKHARTLS